METYKDYEDLTVEEMKQMGLTSFDPPCHKCKPELKKVNVPFFVLYSYCQDQVITGPGGAVALRMSAIKLGMDDYQIDQDERVEFSLRVRYIANIIISAQYKEAETKRKAAKKQ